MIGGDRAAGLVRMCCFHPAYGYEDFIEGYRPEAADGKVGTAVGPVSVVPHALAASTSAPASSARTARPPPTPRIPPP